MDPKKEKSIMPDPNSQDVAEMKAVDMDALRLADMGYSQEMKRKFSTLSLLGICFSLTSSWFGFCASLVTGLSSGGTVLAVYGIPLLGCISACVGASLSELASAMPNAGGEYFWTGELAKSKRYAHLASFLTGWFAWAGSIFTTASRIYQLNHPDFIPQAWHTVAAYEFVSLFAFFFNCVGRILPTISTTTMYISLISLITIFVTVPATTPAHANTKFVFATFTNSTGWSSNGLAFLLGLINPNWLFVCLDAATHMAEEISQPETAIPTAIMGTVGVGLVSSWLLCIALYFSITNLDALVNTATGVPILELFYQTLGSRAGATLLEALVLTTGIGCQIASHTYQSRVCWSFARDRGLPGHAFLSKIHPTLDVPLNAHIVSSVLVSLLGLLYLGSSTAFNSLVTACIVLLCVVCHPDYLLLKKRTRQYPPWPFRLGKLGLLCNWVVLLWTVFCLVVYSLPAVYPVTGGNMNYVSVVYAAVGGIILLDWVVRGRKVFWGLTARHDEVLVRV
ncbi:amino acid transporter [Aspergillus ellipticus CBS 707.79]|uniref:Amino acid transporter n=1 Tax=Aspergillus ellipticus CBS 707.79 TaxID=1448320 RepID=A0A319DB03_9EURO|nr:amino acid transporter [Aspergillus ellipticus CBS 707.79]